MASKLKGVKVRSAKVYAFIDSQNLNLGVRSQGWKLDWRKFNQKQYIIRIDLLRNSLKYKKRLALAVGRNLRLVQSS